MFSKTESFDGPELD